MYKFEKLALQLRKLIEQGVWKAHEKLPSLREQVIHSGYSLMTVMNAYQELEAQGLIYSTEKSGYYVADRLPKNKLLSQTEPKITDHIQINSLVFDYLTSTHQKNVIPLGSAFPQDQLLRHPKLMQILAKHAKRPQSYNSVDSMPPGHLPLQQFIARRYLLQGLDTSANDIVITSGCLDALTLSLKAVAKPSDYILLQQTIFYGAWQAAEHLGLKVITLPEHPTEGFNIDLFEQCLKKYPIKVCWLMVNFHNPIGFTLGNDIKQKIAALLNQYQVYMIEDDVYQELFYGAHKPLPVKYYDQNDWVLHCSSFSKTLGAGFRVGWVNNRKFSERIQHLQLMSTLSVSPLLQHALAEFVASHHYEKHLRQLRQQLERHKKQFYSYLIQHLSDLCDIYYYDGGYFLWMRLPSNIDSMSLYQQLIAQNISVTPSALFNIEQNSSHHIRINCSYAWNDDIKHALGTLITLIKSGF